MTFLVCTFVIGTGRVVGHLYKDHTHASIFNRGLLFAVDNHTEGSTSDGNPKVLHTTSNCFGIVIETLGYDGGLLKYYCEIVTHLTKLLLG